ncbi:hypothetical protein CDD80_2851 [Ophiocordyceps camponoti-rufipedis]|uniref:Uncharacterized protein n=1 Tax=Ophiocordyceps camponoti-rufipedis TaxID=2004952 RepID=A0A2C5XJL7_9HYPO|nr:hypothetical protein CDD80_2851 [Ophiocordyceps camponoti-rufipedis]
MWERLRSNSSSSAGTTTMPAQYPDDARLLLRSGQKQPRLARIRGVHRPERPLDDLAPDPISNALGISTGPCRYEIRRGKVVPRLEVNASPPRHHLEPPAFEQPAMPQYELVSGGTISEEQVSPPSSPGLGYAELGLVADNISPLDNEPVFFQQPQQRETSHLVPHLPSLHGPRRRPINTLNLSDETKQARRRHEALRNHDSKSSSAHPARVPPAALNQRVRLMIHQLDSADARPPWKGMSGRSALLPPIDDDLYVAPLNIRRKTPAPEAGPATGSSLSETFQDGDRMAPSITQPPMPTRGPANDCSSELYEAYPSPPDSQVCTPSPSSSWFETSPLVAVPWPSDRIVIRKKPVDVALVDNKTSSTAKHFRDETVSQDVWSQPASRFSVTTCATSIPPTPRQLPPVPPPAPSAKDGIPSPPEQGRNSPTSSDEAGNSPCSTVNSARPSYPQPRVLAMKDHHLVPDRGTWAFPRTATKPLPPAPPELSQSNSRISQLNVQMQSLVHRRINLNRSIQKMTELMPSDSLFAGQEVLRKREKEKRKVQALRDELALVQREEYDVGLKLHRAYKRQERDGDFQESVLWVRRVTG